MKIFKNLVLIFILTLGVVLGVDHARSSDDYIVALEFKQTKNLMKMSKKNQILNRRIFINNKNDSVFNKSFLYKFLFFTNLHND
jgi:hypothetical protein